MYLPQEWKLGPFRVDRAGMLSPASPEHFPVFGVRWRERRVAVRMQRGKGASVEPGTLLVQVRLGRVPSSAGRDVSLRQAALAAVASLPRHGPQSWQWRLLPDHAVMLEAHLQISLPVGVVDLVSEITQFLLALDPYLDALDAVGMAPSPTIH